MTEKLIRQTEKQQNLESAAAETLQALHTENIPDFLQKIHPEKGVRFSMYAFVQPKRDKVFTKKNFEKYWHTTVKFTWGEKDGTGDLYQASLQDYVRNWVFKTDFSTAKSTVNFTAAQGNSMNNIHSVYPQAEFVEYYIAGTEQYSGMDWQALRLVFEKFEKEYFLVAVINDQWTS